jgi:hypothetical protein
MTPVTRPFGDKRLNCQRTVARCQDEQRETPYIFLNFTNMMDLQLKVFRWPNHRDHIAMVVRGTIDLTSIEQILSKAAELSGPLENCKILVDLTDAQCNFQPEDTDSRLSRVISGDLLRTSQIALVYGRAKNGYLELCRTIAKLSNEKFRAAVFDDPTAAAEWLVNR